MPARWCVLEQYGHRRFAGRVTEVELFGRRMGQIEVPKRDGTFEVVHFDGASVFALTEVGEERVRAELARRWADEDRWNAPALPAARSVYLTADELEAEVAASRGENYVRGEPGEDDDDEFLDEDDVIELGPETPPEHGDPVG